MRCPSCDHDNRPERRFCAECGAALAAVCASCNAPNQPGEKFCGGCGARLPTEAPAVAVSPPAREPDAALPAGERRQLTVLFCDLVGSTPLSQQLDAEEWRDVIEAYHRTAAAAVTRFGGHVAQYLGDGLLIYFGWPTAREDDPERAIRAGLAILDAMVPLNATLAAGDGTRLAVRIGMHTGPVVVAEGGEVFGETANVAARAQSAAEPDTVVITAATQRLVAGMFVVEDRGPQALKGVREPVTLYRVVRPSGVRGRLAVAAGRLTPFVGREAELATLVERWEQARDGAGQNVVVLGEAGVGKSRLVYQLHEHLAAVPHTWLECGATPYTEGTPFHPVIALLTQGLAFAPEDTAAEQLGKLEGRLGVLASPETVALLADFLGLPPPTRLQMSPELQRRKTIDLLAQWTLSLSAVQPLVLFIEDLHWCDASTLELLGHVIAQCPTARVLLLATARPEFTPPWPARSNLTTVQLARLTKRQARDMIATLAGTELPPDTLDALVARADGVPLYVEELTKAVLEPGAARGVEAIPATLADSLMARLDALGPAKEVAQVASVVGREFSYALLHAVTGLDGAPLERNLDRIVGAEIVSMRGVPPDAVYAFRHALVRDVAYESLLKRRRRELHHTIAEKLLETPRETAETRPELVAFHYAEAGLVAEAIPHLRRAGERAVASAANREAVRHLTRALDLLATLPANLERDAIELSLLLPLGVAWMAAQGYAAPETERAFARAHTLCRGMGETPALVPILSGLLTFAVVRAELARAREIGEQLLAMAERTADAALLANAHLRLAVVCEYEGRPRDARWNAEECLARSKASESVPAGYSENPITAAGLYRALALWRLGHPDQALATATDAVELARRVRHPLSLAQALVLALQVRVYRREWEAARAEAVAAIEFCTEKGFPLWAIAGVVHHGGILAELGQVEEAVAQVERGIAEWRATGARVGSAVFFTMLARCYAKAGRVDDGLRVVAEALAMTAETGERSEDAELHRLHGELLLQLPDGASGAAEAALLCGLQVAREQGARAWELRAATSLARLWQRQGKRDAARALLAPLYAWFTEGFDTRDLKDAQALLAELR